MPSQACDRCGVLCGSLQRLLCYGYDGKRFCERCWNKVGRRKYEAKRLKQGWTRIPGGFREPAPSPSSPCAGERN